MAQDQIFDGEGDKLQILPPSPPSPSEPQLDRRQPSETLTLNPQNPHENLTDSNYIGISQNQDQLAMIGEDQNQYDTDEDNESKSGSKVNWVAAASSVPRGGPKRKKLLRQRVAQEKRSRKRFEILIGNFKPIPFVPVKNLDFLGKEKLLKRVGLWDFVHIEFDNDICVDLVVQLIGNYNPSKRCSFVDGVRFGVNRADLARALKLPVRKDKVSVLDIVNEGLEFKESIQFMEDLALNWVFLHEDAVKMLDEVMNWMKVIKEGNYQKLDWARLIWFMVEKELMQGPLLMNCYFASHLQRLIRYQQGKLLREESIVGTDDKEIDVKEEQEDCRAYLKMDEDNDFRGPDLEEQKIELSLGQENVNIHSVENEQLGDENVMDFEQCKEEEDVQWQMDWKNNAVEHFLRCCNLDEVRDEDFEKGRKQEVEVKELVEKMGEEDQHQEEEQEQSFIQAMEGGHIPFSTELQPHDHSSGVFLSSKGGTHKIPAGSSIFNNVSKSEIGHEVSLSHNALDFGNKRLRSCGTFTNKSSNYNMCLEQMQQLMEKARMMYEEIEQSHEELTINQQVLLNELQQRDQMIEHLHKSNCEEQRKRQAKEYRIVCELYMMKNLLDNYRKALKETYRAFAEYRAHHPQPDEPLYKDVHGSGGLVVSTMELERLRLKREEVERMNRIMIEKNIKDFEIWWSRTFDAHLVKVEWLDSKLLDAKSKFKCLKTSLEKSQLLEDASNV